MTISPSSWPSTRAEGESGARAHGHGNQANDAGGLGSDPHIWLSPALLQVQARTVAATLARLDPEAGDDCRRRLTRLEQRLDRLDADLRRLLTPFAEQPFLVFHPAWGYFAADLRLRQLTLEIEGKEPSEAEVW